MPKGDMSLKEGKNGHGIPIAKRFSTKKHILSGSDAEEINVPDTVGECEVVSSSAFTVYETAGADGFPVAANEKEYLPLLSMDSFWVKGENEQEIYIKFYGLK